VIFETKGIFLWCYWDIFGGDTKKTAQALVDAGFETAYVHTNDGPTQAFYSGRVNCTDQLVADLRAAGLKIVGWGAPYGGNIAGEIGIMVSQTQRYQLDGYVIDAEGTWDARTNAVANTKQLITGYKLACPDVPVCWCWWAMHKDPLSGRPWHPIAILEEAMKYADAGMPMAYWSWGDTPAKVVQYLDSSWAQWCAVTIKPIIPAGRAWNGDGGLATRAGVLAFDNWARTIGAAGLTWWDMQHAVRLPETWQALSETKKFDGEEIPMADYSKNAVGLYTKAATWTNKDFDFIIGHAGDSWNDPNPALKPIELRAAEMGQTFGALWDFDVDWYSYKQFMGDDVHWPPVDKDLPLQKCIQAITSRDIKFMVVRVMTFTSPSVGTKPEDPAYISYAARKFMLRLGDWLDANKPGCKLILATSHGWIIAHAPNMNNWAHQFPTMVIQQAISPLVSNAYPQGTDKVKNYISTRPTCEFWWYYDTSAVDLVLFYLGDGTPVSLATWLGTAAPDPDPDPDPVYPLAERVVKLEAAIKTQGEQLAALEAWKVRILEATK
jgi:hypothetical protein